MKRHVLTLIAVGIVCAMGTAAWASAPRVGPLPAGTTTSYRTTPDRVFSVTLPKPAIKGGVWRIARAFNSEVVRQQGERTLATGAVRITLRTTGPGTTRVVFALTKGETAKAYAARTFEITVGDKPPPETR